ncbi:MAG: NADP-specific glutamate dehydrogenase [Cytophagales bacterium]|nr:NADP-specific glutamate dehydrogenase [Cytophagales bacterium]
MSAANSQDTLSNKKLHSFLSWVEEKNPGEIEFIQAVRELSEVVIPYIQENPRYEKMKILDRMVEPERIIIFRVPWMDDKGNYHVNRGYRVQMNSALGPYKGGLRFHPSVNLSILKFLAFEQTFKNSLTTLPLGSGKGGSDFDPKAKSDAEVMRFCQSFMTELSRHIGSSSDVPAGDIGVGTREIGYMFGHYRRLINRFEGVFTGKSLKWGGSYIRPEATGYGCVYFSDEVLSHHQNGLAGKEAIISGSGNVAQYTAEKLIELKAKVLTLSDSQGYIYDPDGIDTEKLSFVKDLKNLRRGRIREDAEKYPRSQFVAGRRPWEVPCDLAYPSATQNELNLEDAKELLKNKCLGVFEGANMPVTLEATSYLQEHGVIFAPGKASNAGGVATSGLEMSQNSQRLSWKREEVDKYLRSIMINIHKECVLYGPRTHKGVVNYLRGANIAGFVKVAEAMLEQGLT